MNDSPMKPTVFEQGLGLFGSPEDTALLDEVVQLAYELRSGQVARSEGTLGDVQRRKQQEE